jgi:hypothetical protein
MLPHATLAPCHCLLHHYPNEYNRPPRRHAVLCHQLLRLQQAG